MENQMSQSRVKIGLALTILVLVALFAAFWAVSVAFNTHSISPQERRTPPSGAIAGDLEFFYLARTIVATVNIALLITLILMFATIYRKTHSQFTIGLIIFAAVFLMKDFTSYSYVTTLFGYRVFGLGPFVLLPDLLETAALSVLLYLNIKY